MLGDIMPDSDEIHMPSYLSTADIHREYILEMLDKGFHQEDLPSLERFRKLKRDSFPQIKFPKHTSLGVCDDCTNFRSQKLAAKTPLERENIRIRILQHSQHHMSERKEFKCRCAHSQNLPHQQWVILTDVADKYAIPYIHPLPKGWGKIKRLPVNCFGLTNFALREKELTFFLPIVPHNSNLSISMLYNHLYRMINNPAVQRAPVVHFQDDNAYKDSKNKYNLAFCSLLVQLDIFQEIYFS